MKIARMIAPVHSLGPGARLCLWTQGCGKRCPGCLSPELQPFTGQDVPEQALAEILISAAKGSRKLTVSGGDPLEQAEALLALLQALRPHFDDILVYTGFTLEQLQKGSPAQRDCLGLIDVLIDGPYIDSLNTHGCVLRGSENQRIHYLNPALKEDYEACLKEGRLLETFSHGGRMIITGIPDRRDNP